MNFMNETIHRLNKKALRKKTKIVVNYFIKESRRELLKEKLPSELIKSYPAYLPRFVGCSRTRLGGVGCLLSSRLYSTRYPKRRGELRHVSDNCVEDVGSRRQRQNTNKMVHQESITCANRPLTLKTEKAQKTKTLLAVIFGVVIMVVGREEKDCVRRYLVRGRATREGNVWLPAFVLVKDDCREGYSIEGVSVIREGGEEEVLKGKVHKIFMNGEFETGKFDLLFEMRDKARRYTVIVKFRKWKPKTASIVFD